MTNKTITLEHAGLNKRAINALNRAGITTLNQLKATPENKLHKVPDLGRQSFRAIRDAIKEYLPYADNEIVITREDAKQVLKGVIQLGTKIACLEDMVSLNLNTQKASREVVLLISAVTGSLLQLTEQEIEEVLNSVKSQVRKAVKATDDDDPNFCDDCMGG
tara:strand:- start:15 stop:500 length:486 start_codon:yes stop_codon:yes gene_type:complete